MSGGGRAGGLTPNVAELFRKNWRHRDLRIALAQFPFYPPRGFLRMKRNAEGQPSEGVTHSRHRCK